MNKDRRKRITKIIDKISEAKDELEEIQDAEEEAYNNMFEWKQDSEVGEESQAAVGFLEEAISSLEEAQQHLGNIE